MNSFCGMSVLPVFFYFFRLKDDHIVDSLVLANVNEDDPELRVETLAPDGTTQRWWRREEDGCLVFYPPDGYAGIQGLLLNYSRNLQQHAPAPPEMMERLALRNRHTA